MPVEVQMQSQHDFDTEIPNWATPWAAGWSKMRANSSVPSKRPHRVDFEHRQRVLMRPQPQHSLLRIRTIGVVASSAAAAVWVVAIAWLQIGA